MSKSLNVDFNAKSLNVPKVDIPDVNVSKVAKSTDVPTKSVDATTTLKETNIPTTPDSAVAKSAADEVPVNFAKGTSKTSQDLVDNMNAFSKVDTSKASKELKEGAANLLLKYPKLAALGLTVAAIMGFVLVRMAQGKSMSEALGEIGDAAGNVAGGAGDVAANAGVAMVKALVKIGWDIFISFTYPFFKQWFASQDSYEQFAKYSMIFFFLYKVGVISILISILMSMKNSLSRKQRMVIVSAPSL
jgi:hypothetical protein